MMKRITMIIVSIMMLISCGSEIDKKIPDSMLVGAVPNISVDIKEQKGKNVKGGRLLEAIGTVPFDIKKEQIKPTILAVIKAIKQKNPDCEWIAVHLKLAKDLPLLQAGIAEYKEGNISISYGIPSDKQIEEWNANIGKPVEFDGKVLGINDLPRLYRPDRKTFEDGAQVIKLYYKLNNDPKIKKDRIEQLFPLISKESGLPVKDVESLYRYMSNYYFTGSWGTEEFKIQ
jgi:hypothetical protein